MVPEVARDVVEHGYAFRDKDEAREIFTCLTGAFREVNYARWGSGEYEERVREVCDLVEGYRGYAASSDVSNGREAGSQLATAQPDDQSSPSTSHDSFTEGLG